MNKIKRKQTEPIVDRAKQIDLLLEDPLLRNEIMVIQNFINICE